jgi:hypothetical protein
VFPLAVRQCVFGVCIALGTGAIHASDNADAEIAIRCEFPLGLGAIYIFDRGEARVRRADLLQPREGAVKVTPAELRFIFQERGSDYRIDVVIDRANGNARRVAGTRDKMQRMPQRHDRDSGLAYEMGQCGAQYADLL